MKIINLTICDHFQVLFDKTFNDNTLIWSSKNSYGKTTLIRFLLFSLGFDIPSTKKIHMKKYKCILKAVSPKRTIIREDNIFTIKCEEEGIEKKFNLNTEKAEAFSFLYGISNQRLVDNLLGAFYIDQDFGWSMVNSGKVISTINFDIRDFVLGLSLKDVNELDSKIKKIDEQINRYKAIQNIVLLSEEQQTDYRENEQISKLKLKKVSILNNLHELKKQQEELEQIYKDNNTLKKLIESYKLAIKYPNQLGYKYISEDDIIDYKLNQMMVMSEINELAIAINKLKYNLADINNDLSEYTGLTNVEENSKSIIKVIKSHNISQTKLVGLLDDLKNEKNNLEKQKNDVFDSQTIINKELTNNIKKFASTLKVFEFIGNKVDILKNKKIKENSGALLHKITLCYRLAYYLALKKFANLNIPFIVDSPGSAEIKSEDVEEMINLIKENVGNQIIISSVLDKEIFFDKNTTLILDRGIFGTLNKNS